MNFIDRLNEYVRTHDDTDRCVYCGNPDCDKIALPDLSYVDHPERQFEGDMCHDDCEKDLMANAPRDLRGGSRVMVHADVGRENVR